MSRASSSPDGATSIDNLVNPVEVGGVEVYTDLMSAPAEYRRGSCGVIVVWTKGALQ